ncbi:DUF6301 family protein [Nocardia sp. NPDC005978]|uniref:DUF6301 family protein n=1 Tax=Nocardia sp. NPDC005978 TaxID=3156725 RepID=UPI0033A51B38
MTLFVDLEGAVRIVRLAVPFGWTWTLNDVRSFCGAAGWREVWEDDVAVIFATDLGVAEPRANAYTNSRLAPALAAAGHDIEEISVYVADSGPQLDADAAVAEPYSRLADLLAGELGQPMWSMVDPRIETGWELPDVIIGVVAEPGWVELVLTNPLYRRRIERLEDEWDEE